MRYYVDDHELMDFNYNEVSSTSFFMIIEEIDGLLDTFERDIDLIEVMGRDGELIIDNHRKKSKDIIVRGHIDVEKSYFPVDILAVKIEEWLQSEISYKPLFFKNHDIKYNAICFNQIKLSEVIKDLCSFEITFRVNPNVELMTWREIK